MYEYFIMARYSRVRSMERRLPDCEYGIRDREYGIFYAPTTYHSKLRTLDNDIYIYIHISTTTKIYIRPATVESRMDKSLERRRPGYNHVTANMKYKAACYRNNIGQ